MSICNLHIDNHDFGRQEVAQKKGIIMKFSIPAATVVPLVLQNGRLKVALAHHTAPDGAKKLRLLRQEVDPDQDSNLDFCARRALIDAFDTNDGHLVECRLDTGRDTVAEMRNDINGEMAPRAWGIRALYCALMRPASLDSIRECDVELFDLHDCYDISTFEEDPGSLMIGDRGVDPMIVMALKVVDVHMRERGQMSKLPAFLVGDEFSLSELQEAYEATVGITIDSANFRRKIEALNMITRVGERREPSRRPTALYRLQGMRIDLDRNIFSGGASAMTV
jgi:hypothetical protein